MSSIDLSADIGESFGSYTMGDDERIVESITSANIACGFHAGDPRTMERAVAQCVAAGVGVGAHPAFHDLVGFGRRQLHTTSDELRTDVLYQLGALNAFATAAGTRIGHVSPHGRLGNLVTEDDAYALPVLDAIAMFDEDLVVVTYSGRLEQLARQRGVKVGLLGFPDRAYEPNGGLVSRREEGAVLHDVEQIAERAVALATTGIIEARTGDRIEIECDSLLLHGDNAASVQAAHQVRAALEQNGVSIVPISTSLAGVPVKPAT